MFNFLRKKIGIIGFGNMGQAIAERISSKYVVWVFEKDTAKTKGLTGITAASDIAQLLKQSQAIVLAIKPQDFEPVMAEIKDNLQDKLVISIAAGITTEYIQKVLGRVRVVRVMPNLAVKVGRSVTSICKGVFATDSDIKFVARLFKYLGKVFIFSEEMMDAATAIAGSGPGFWCDLVKDKPMDEWEQYNREYFIPELSLAAENLGFNKKKARLFSGLTTSATLLTVQALHIAPEALRDKIASKGGTTQAGLEALHNTGSLIEAALAAKKRAQELSKKE
ncbi:MAG: pyrroline-5-carboxylate reductase [Candidatus Omnitrophica bacterium]|nr:pyrroline-5-carboxylate reductase [Candidatus Omnitrophota bacterium]